MADTTRSTAPPRTVPGATYGQATPFPKIQKPPTPPAPRTQSRSVAAKISKAAAPIGSGIHPPAVKRANRSISQNPTLPSGAKSRSTR